MTGTPPAMLPAMGRAVGTVALAAGLLSGLVGLTIVSWVATSIVLHSGKLALIWALYMGLIVGVPAAMIVGIVAMVGGMAVALALVPLLRRVGLAAGLAVAAIAAITASTVALISAELLRTAVPTSWSIPPLTGFGEWVPAALVAGASLCAAAAYAVVDRVTLLTTT